MDTHRILKTLDIAYGTLTSARASSPRLGEVAVSDALSSGHTVFEVDAQAVDDTVDVVEERDHLGGIVDGLVGKAQLPQTINVSLSHCGRCFRQLDGMIAQGPIDLGQLGLGIVGLDLLDPGGVLDLSPEVISMGLNSVAAAVGLGHHDGQHLTLSPCQRRVTMHCDPVEFEHRLKCGWVIALNLDDVVDPAGALADLLVDAAQQPVSFVFVNEFDPGHQSSTVTVECLGIK